MKSKIYITLFLLLTLSSLVYAVNPFSLTTSINTSQIVTNKTFTLTVQTSNPSGINMIKAGFQGSWNNFICPGTSSCQNNWTITEPSAGNLTYYLKVIDSAGNTFTKKVIITVYKDSDNDGIADINEAFSCIGQTNLNIPQNTSCTYYSFVNGCHITNYYSSGYSCGTDYSEYSCYVGNSIGDDIGSLFHNYGCDGVGTCLDNSGSWNVYQDCTTSQICTGNGTSQNVNDYSCQSISCTPNLVNTTWSLWTDTETCQLDNTQNQERTKTQYDNNYCGTVSNTTYYEYQDIVCDYCTPNWIAQNTSCVNGNITGYYIDSNSCFATTGLGSDNNPPANNTYYCAASNITINLPLSSNYYTNNLLNLDIVTSNPISYCNYNISGITGSMTSADNLSWTASTDVTGLDANNFTVSFECDGSTNSIYPVFIDTKNPTGFGVNPTGSNIEEFFGLINLTANATSSDVVSVEWWFWGSIEGAVPKWTYIGLSSVSSDNTFYYLWNSSQAFSQAYGAFEVTYYDDAGRINITWGASNKEIDNAGPHAVNLSVSTGDVFGVLDLNWTAPYDSGPLANYTIKIYNQSITNMVDWGNAITINSCASTRNSPGAVGDNESCSVNVTDYYPSAVGGEIYYFAVISEDNLGQASNISNSAGASLLNIVNTTVTLNSPINYGQITGVYTFNASVSADVVNATFYYDDGGWVEIGNNVSSNGYVVYTFDTNIITPIITTFKVIAYGDQIAEDNSTSVEVDNKPPLTITDLVALPGASSTPNANNGYVDLYWTTPDENNGSGGFVDSYEIKIKTDSNITEANWDSLTDVCISETPGIWGNPANCSKGSLIENGTQNYCFAIKSYDNLNQSSEISNVDCSPTGYFDIGFRYMDYSYENAVNHSYYLYDATNVWANVTNHGNRDEINLEVILTATGDTVGSKIINLSVNETKLVNISWVINKSVNPSVRIDGGTTFSGEFNISNHLSSKNIRVYSIIDDTNLTWFSPVSFPSFTESVGTVFKIAPNVNNTLADYLYNLPITLDVNSSFSVNATKPLSNCALNKTCFINVANLGNEVAWWDINPLSAGDYNITITTGAHVGDQRIINRLITVS